jgi:hypothetical protein
MVVEEDAQLGRFVVLKISWAGMDNAPASYDGGVFSWLVWVYASQGFFGGINGRKLCRVI